MFITHICRRSSLSHSLLPDTVCTVERLICIYQFFRHTIHARKMSCNGCQWTILDFCAMARDIEQLLNFLVLHHVLLDSWWCESFGELCRKDLSHFTFHCDRCHVSRDSCSRRQTWRCRYYRSMFTGTWFGRSRLSMSQVCQFNCLWLNLPYPRQSLIKTEIGVSVKTVVDWSCFCREVCIFWLEKRTILSGPGVMVKIDEAKLGKRKYNGQVD